MISLSSQTEETWIALARSYRSVIEKIEGALKAADLPPLEWYDILLEVERSKANGIRPFELQERLLLPQYSTSRLLDRMVKKDLIEKVSCEDDGRGFHIKITKKGQETRRQIWPVYSKALSEALQSPLSRTQSVTLSKLLNTLQKAAYNSDDH